MIIYTLYTAVVSSLWSITTSLLCWLFGGTLPTPSPCRILRVSHGSPQGFSATPHFYNDNLPSTRASTPTIIYTFLEDVRPRVDHGLHLFLQNTSGWFDDGAPYELLLSNFVVVAFSDFWTFCSRAFVLAYSLTVAVSSSFLVFIVSLFGNFGFKAFFDHLRRFVTWTVQTYTTLKAGGFFKNFPLQNDPSFLSFFYLVLKIVHSYLRALEKFDSRFLNGCGRRYLNGNPEHSTTFPIEEPTPDQGSIPWNASTLSTILFDSIQSSTTISFSLSLLSSASILLPQYLLINLSSSRRRDVIFQQQTVPEELLPPTPGGDFGELSSDGRSSQGSRRRRTILRDSKQPKSLNATFEGEAPEDEVEEGRGTLPPATTAVEGEKTPEHSSFPNTNCPSVGSHHNDNDDPSELVEVAITPSLSTTPTLFLSSSSDYSDPFTHYSFLSPPLSSTLGAPHPPKRHCKNEHTLVNDRSDFLSYSPPQPSPQPQSYTNPLASFHSNDEFMKTIKLESHCPIGQGSFGTVWKATGGGGGGGSSDDDENDEGGREKQYAVKIVKRVKGHDKVLANEIAAMWNVSKSRWAVQLDYWQASEDAVLLAMRYCMGGSLLNIWESSGCRMDSKLAVFYAAELILAIHDLHTRGIMHRDIKLDNIMLDNGHIRIADFGLALSFDHGAVSKAIYPIFCHLIEMGGDAFPPLFAAPHNPHIARGACGTPGYGPPEVWSEESYSFGVDYFAMGCTLHAMLTGDLPYHWVEKDDDYDLKELRIDPRGFLTEVERDFLAKALAYKPSHRLSVRRMKQHPLFAHIDWNALAQGRVEPPTL